jgi:hypothetical protein
MVTFIIAFSVANIKNFFRYGEFGCSNHNSKSQRKVHIREPSSVAGQEQAGFIGYLKLLPLHRRWRFAGQVIHHTADTRQFL